MWLPWRAGDWAQGRFRLQPGDDAAFTRPGGLTGRRPDTAPGEPPESQAVVLPGRGPGQQRFRGARGGRGSGAFGIKGLAARIYVLSTFSDRASRSIISAWTRMYSSQA